MIVLPFVSFNGSEDAKPNGTLTWLCWCIPGALPHLQIWPPIFWCLPWGILVAYRMSGQGSLHCHVAPGEKDHESFWWDRNASVLQCSMLPLQLCTEPGTLLRFVQVVEWPERHNRFTIVFVLGEFGEFGECRTVWEYEVGKCCIFLLLSLGLLKKNSFQRLTELWKFQEARAKKKILKPVTHRFQEGTEHPSFRWR